MKFTVGDRVMCLDNHSYKNLLKKGTIYTVTKCNIKNGRVSLAEVPSETFFPERFTLSTTSERLMQTAMIAAQQNVYGGTLEYKNTSTKSNKEFTLPTDSLARKNYPLFKGVLCYFPAALAGVANISKVGNDKHNPGQELHHARGKSTDHGDCVIRHLIDAADLLAALERGNSSVTQQDVLNEVSQLAWRALALSQELHEKFGAPLAPGAKK